MPIASFSARRLENLLIEISEQPTIGLDLLRDITARLRTIIDELDEPARKVVAWMLIKTLQSICERYDGEPMTVDASEAVAGFVRGPVQEALRFMGSDTVNPNQQAIELAARLITQK